MININQESVKDMVKNIILFKKFIFTTKKLSETLSWYRPDILSWAAKSKSKVPHTADWWLNISIEKKLASSEAN